MAIPPEHKGRFMYQFTHLQNLPTILQHGLLSYNEKAARGIGHISIAEESIQARRARMTVPCGPGGVIHDYVPFYFCSRSSMLLAVVNAKNVDQEFLIYLAVPIDILERPECVFTSASANTEVPPIFYSDVSRLVELDWRSIDAPQWSMPSDKEKQARMAEGMVHRSLAVTEISHIIVWSDAIKKMVERQYTAAGLVAPKTESEKVQRRHFYYTRFNERNKSSIVTGPMILLVRYETTLEAIRTGRAESPPESPQFKGVVDAVEKLKANFALLPELTAIETLETDNKEHCQSVGDHTKQVVAKLLALDSYQTLGDREKSIAILSAYLHDIGKGKSPRSNGKQKADPDHPARGLRLLVRILTEEFVELSAEDVRQIAMLVCYHDLIGDVIGKGRDRNQILEIVKWPNDFDMLAALCLADVSSLIRDDWAAILSPHANWLVRIKSGLPELREWVLANLKKAE